MPREDPNVYSSIEYEERIDLPEKVYEFQPRTGRLKFSSLLVNRRGKTLLAFLAFFIIISVVQRLTGAVAASFGLYPDEPSHYLSSLMLRDYLASGFHESPIAFAVNYYAALPYFAIGYWPPAFYIIGGIWMLLFGVQRASALALTAVVTALLAATVFQVAYRRASNGWTAGMWALLVLLVPQVIASSSMYMLDLPVALFSLWALLEEIRYFKAPDRPRHAIGYTLCASLAFLAKFSGAFVFLFPVVALLGTRKWSVLRSRWFWAQPAIVIALCGPWVLYTHRLMYVGLPPGGTPVHSHLAWTFVAFLGGFVRVAGPVLVASAGAGIWMTVLKKRWDLELFLYAAAPVCLMLFLVASPVDPEYRYFLPALAPWILLIACSFERLKFSKMRALGIVVPGLLAVAGAARCVMTFPHFPPDPLYSLVKYVNANPKWKNASILLPADCEGPAIAEFAEHTPHRLSHTLLRPSKVMGISGWWGIEQTRYTSAAAFEQALAQNPIDLIVVDRLRTMKTPVDRLIQGAIQKFPNDWAHVAVIRSRCGPYICGLWGIYASKKASGAVMSPIFRKRTLNRYKFWRKHANP